MQVKIIILMLLVATSALAADCQTINLITQPNSPFQKIPVYHQGRTNICYAYAAAQLIDFHLLKSGASERSVHPAWLALQYALSKGRKKLDIGHTKNTLEVIKSSGNCKFQVVAEAIKNWSPEASDSDAKIIAGIEKSTSQTPVDILTRLFDLSCTEVNRDKVVLPTVSSFNHRVLPEDRSYADFIDRRLDQAASPISISYCSNIWKNPLYKGIDKNQLQLRNMLKEDCHYHESIIVGKKLVNNNCQALVRNTLGADWSTANSQWKCLCRNKLTNEYVDDCDAQTHKAGHFSVEACWLPLEQLSKNIGVVTFLD